MKLQNEYSYVLTRFRKLKNLKHYAEGLRRSDNYNDFVTRLAFDCAAMTIPLNLRCEWYDKYNCTDSHLKTLYIKALKTIAKEQGLEL